MKLEDIELQLGDKITHDNGMVEYYNGKIIGWQETIVKIERLEVATYLVSDNKGVSDKLDKYEPLFLKIIWEKEEPTNDDIEEIKLISYDEYSKLHDVDKFTKLSGTMIKLNEVIRKLNKHENNK